MGSVRVYVDGIFDLFHAGHAKLFKKAIAKGQELFPGREVVLLVGVCDDDVEAYKRKTVMTYVERKFAVSQNEHVSEVLLAGMTLTADYIIKHGIDLAIHGDDFDKAKQHLYYGPAVDAGKFATVPYEAGVSTTQLLRDAKSKGRFSIDLSATCIDESELVRRIQERTWEVLRVGVQKTS